MNRLLFALCATLNALLIVAIMWLAGHYSFL